MADRNDSSDKILEIVARRLRGEPVMNISRDIGVSRQYIYRIFGRLPKGHATVVHSLQIDMETQEEIVMTYLSKVPAKRGENKRPDEQRWRAAISSTAEELGVCEKEVSEVLAKMTEHHPCVVHSGCHATLQQWREEYAVSLADIAAIVGCSQSKMREILRGKSRLTKGMARKISNKSGIEVNVLLAEQQKEVVD